MKINTTAYSNQELLSLILIGITGSAAVNILPFIVNALAHAPDLNVAEASEIASIELVGLSLMGLCYRYWQGIGNPKTQVLLGIGFYCLGNLALILSANIFDSYSSLALWRFIAGAGAGMASAVAFAAIARQNNPDGIFAILIFFQVLWSSAGSFAMPVLMESINWSSAFGFILVFGVIALAVVYIWCPDLKQTAYHASEDIYSEDNLNKSIILIASVIWYIALGLFWGDSAQTGDEIGVSPVMIGAIFAFGYLVSLSGNGIALWLSQRYDRKLPLMISGVIHAGVYMLFTLSEIFADVAMYTFAVLLFSLTWAVFTPFQIGLFSSVKSDGSFATNFLPSSIIGILIGTAIGPMFNNDQKLWLAIISIGVCLAMYQLYMNRQRYADDVTDGSALDY
jgi:MFS family permease